MSGAEFDVPMYFVFHFKNAPAAIYNSHEIQAAAKFLFGDFQV